MVTEKEGFKDVFAEYHAEEKRWGDLAGEQDKIGQEQRVLLDGHIGMKRTYEANQASDAIVVAQKEADRLRAGWKHEKTIKWLPRLNEAMPAYEESNRFVINELDLTIFTKLNEVWQLVKTRNEISYELSENSGELNRMQHPHDFGYRGIPNTLPWGFALSSQDFFARCWDCFREIVKHFGEKANIEGVQDFGQFKRK